MANRDAFWRLWQIQKENQQDRYPGFWNKAISFFTDNYLPFEKQLLACHQALVNTKHLTMGCKMTMQLPITFEVLFDPQTGKLNTNNKIIL